MRNEPQVGTLLCTNVSSGTAAPGGLSVDVEDYYHVEAFADRIRPEHWPLYPQRVVENTRRTLELFAEVGVRGTFFLLGWVAERERGLVREIVNAGHELGCHSYQHQLIYRMTPQEFREDARRARQLIEDAGGQSVVGYRAPTFSITKGSLWAIEILAEEGFVYDSSVFPIRHDIYGMRSAPRFTFQWVCKDGKSLFEVPLSTVRVFGLNLPVGGGGYLRLLPMSYTRWARNRIRKREGRPLVIYFHPWEVDPEQPRLPGKLRSRLRHYTNLRGMRTRLRELLKEGRFLPLRDLLNYQIAKGPLPTYPLHEPTSP